MNDPEDERHAILSDDVVHYAVVADPVAMERVRRSTDRLHLLHLARPAPAVAAANSSSSGGRI